MEKSKRILVAVDGSPGSRQTVRYVADMVAGKPDFHVGLLHLELPPRMLEWGGSEDSAVESKISSERAADYRGLEKSAIEGGQDMLKSLQAILAERRIDVTARLVQFEEPLNAKHITDHILKSAAELEYGTAVVGRHSFFGLKRFFAHHVGEVLVREGKGIAIWVVE